MIRNQGASLFLLLIDTLTPLLPIFHTRVAEVVPWTRRPKCLRYPPAQTLPPPAPPKLLCCRQRQVPNNGQRYAPLSPPLRSVESVFLAITGQGCLQRLVACKLIPFSLFRTNKVEHSPEPSKPPSSSEHLVSNFSPPLLLILY